VIKVYYTSNHKWYWLEGHRSHGPFQTKCQALENAEVFAKGRTMNCECSCGGKNHGLLQHSIEA
jgi:hypothetical protein